MVDKQIRQVFKNHLKQTKQNQFVDLYGEFVVLEKQNLLLHEEKKQPNYAFLVINRGLQ
jgi:N12 class adenine-specific DNA methylase